MYRHDVREKYHRLLSLTPLLIEYTTTIDEESDVSVGIYGSLHVVYC